MAVDATGMDKKRIDEILSDPNTWCRDGYAYIDGEFKKESWEDEFDKHLEELKRKRQNERKN